MNNTHLVLPQMLLASVLIISIALIASDLLRATTTLAVQIADQPTVQVDLNHSVAISPYLLGSNVFPRTGTSSKDQQGRGFMSYDLQVIAGLRSARIKLLRFPGGNWGEEHTLSTEQLNDFSDLLNQVGAEGLMQVQLSDPLDHWALALRKPLPFRHGVRRFWLEPLPLHLSFGGTKCKSEDFVV
jgi:hypothetical protein